MIHGLKASVSDVPQHVEKERLRAARVARTEVLKLKAILAMQIAAKSANTSHARATWRRWARAYNGGVLRRKSREEEEEGNAVTLRREVHDVHDVRAAEVKPRTPGAAPSRNGRQSSSPHSSLKRLKSRRAAVPALPRPSLSSEPTRVLRPRLAPAASDASDASDAPVALRRASRSVMSSRTDKRGVPTGGDRKLRAAKRSKHNDSRGR